MSVWWSVGLAIGAVWSAWLLGNRNRAGWSLGLVLQLGWIVYSVMSRQWGFLASAVVFTVVDARNYLKWKRLDNATPRDEVVLEVIR